MKTSLACLFAFSLILACTPTPTQPTFTCSDGTRVADPARCPKPSPNCNDGAANQGEDGPDCGGPCPGYWYDGSCHPSPPKATPPEPPILIPPQPVVISLFSKAELITNYQYVYDQGETVRQDYAILHKANRSAVRLGDAKMLPGKKYYTIVLVDHTTNSSKAYCRDNTQCDKKNAGPFIVPFAEWDFPTPFDWIGRIKASTSVIVRDQATTYSRPTTRIEFTYEDTPANAWVDNFFGLPIRVEVGKDAVGAGDAVRTYEYRDLGVNRVADADVSP